MESHNGGAQWLSELGMEDSTLVKHFEGFSFPASYQAASFPEPEVRSIGILPSLASIQSEDARKSALDYQDSHKHSMARTHDEQQHQNQKMPKLGYPGMAFIRNNGVSMQQHLHEQQQQHLHLHQQHLHQQQQGHQPHVHVHQQHLHQQQQQQQQPLPEVVRQLKDASYYFHKEKGQNHNNASLRAAPVFQFDARFSGATSAQESCIINYKSVGTMTRERPLSSCESVGDGQIADPSLLQKRGNYEGDPKAPLKTGGQARDHILAERKRREKLSQRFIALSAMLPGLKKMDKATILGDAIKFVKQLQEKLTSLEEQATSTRSVVVVKSSEKESPNVEMLDECQQQDIEVRVIGKNVLIRLHCEKIKGVLVKALAELENLHLIVVNANILSFSDKAFDLTFSMQMEEGCDVTTDVIAKALQEFVKRVKDT